MNIAIVNDLPLAVEMMKKLLEKSGKHSVAWIAENGLEAVRKCAESRPDLILMDLVMPILDGIEATRQIMIASPCPILIVTSTIEHHVSKVFAALGAGALDAVNTPVSGSEGISEANAFLSKIDQIGRLTTQVEAPKAPSKTESARKNGDALVVIGASAGGPAALATVLERLPKDFPAPIVVVQHIDESFAKSLGGWLGEQISMPLHLAQQGERLVPGTVYLAGREEHLVLSPKKVLWYTKDPVDVHYKPSVDVFFESVARHWTGPVVGIILTGMGADGAKGLKKLHDLGHYTLAQDQASSAVYGMPKAAAQAGAVTEVLPLSQISSALLAHMTRLAH